MLENGVFPAQLLATVQSVGVLLGKHAGRKRASGTSEDICPAGLPVAVQSLQTVLGKCQKGDNAISRTVAPLCNNPVWFADACGAVATIDIVDEEVRCRRKSAA